MKKLIGRNLECFGKLLSQPKKQEAWFRYVNNKLVKPALFESLHEKVGNLNMEVDENPRYPINNVYVDRWCNIWGRWVVLWTQMI